jgi:hypothetical protein
MAFPGSSRIRRITRGRTVSLCENPQPEAAAATCMRLPSFQTDTGRQFSSAQASRVTQSVGFVSREASSRGGIVNEGGYGI